MQREDEIYFEQRAKEELELAQQATTAEATKAHYKLANLYLERVHPEADEQGTTQPPSAASGRPRT